MLASPMSFVCFSKCKKQHHCDCTSALSIATPHPHKSVCVCGLGIQVLWACETALHGLRAGLEHSSFSCPSPAPLLQVVLDYKKMLRICIKFPCLIYSNLLQKLTEAELSGFCFTLLMPLIRGLGCMIGFCFFFVACKGAQLIILGNKILFAVTKQISACDVTVQVSVLTCKEMKEYERLMFSVHTYTDLTGISDIKCAWQQHHVADNPPFLRQTEISVCVFAADILTGYSRDVFKFALVGFFGFF